MKKIKRIMAVLICMTITLTGIPVSVNAENSGGKSVQTMETGNELFITLEENTRYRWNVNDSAEKNSVVHLDTSGGDNCRFRLDHIENEWYGIKHIKVDGTDRFADVDGKSKNNGAVLHLWESSDSKVKGNNHRQFCFQPETTVFLPAYHIQCYHFPYKKVPLSCASATVHNVRYTCQVLPLKRYRENLFQNREAVLPCFQYKIQCYGYFSCLFTCTSAILYLLYGLNILE